MEKHTQSLDCGRHFDFQFSRTGGGRVAKYRSFCSPNIFRKSHGSVPVDSKRFRNGVQKIGLGVLLPPSPPPITIWGLSFWLNSHFRFRFEFVRYRFKIVFASIFVSIFVFVNESNIFLLTFSLTKLTLPRSDRTDEISMFFDTFYQYERNGWR
jgi:hypothetical protein